MKKTIFIATMLYSASANIEIKSCDDLQKVFDMAQNEYVNASMHPFADIHCDNFTTFSLGSGYDIDVFSTDNLDNFYGNANFVNVRLEIVNGSKITFEPNILFENYDEEDPVYHDVNGGALFIGKDSTVRFLNKFDTKNIGVRSMTEESSDFANHQNDGGVIHNSGLFEVNGYAKFIRSENVGGGESSPGKSGGIFNNVTGSVVFNKGVEFDDISITDDEGNDGAAMYNMGNVHVRGNSKFFNLRAESAGAIYNDVNATFTFCDGASALFYNCRSSDGVGGSIYNKGNFTFSGPAAFIDCKSNNDAGAIYQASGTMNLSDNSYFFGIQSDGYRSQDAPVVVKNGSEFNFNKNFVTFVGSEKSYPDENNEVEVLCPGVYYEENNKCEY